MKNLFVGALLTVAVGVVGTPARAVDPEDIKQSVARGVQALRRMQTQAGTWDYPKLGATALAVLTLLECGASADDKDLQRAIDAVRRGNIGMTDTYSIALSILMLDRLGDPADVPLIESLTVRLMAGQDFMGGWTYECPGLGEAERRRLQANLDQRKEQVGRRELPKPGAGKRTVKDLPEEIRQQVVEVERLAVVGAQQDAPGGLGVGDNSNTQFAGLALWVGRRQGLPVQRVLDRLGKHFRVSQMEDGGWGYSSFRPHPNAPPMGAMPFAFGFPSTASMTCAGLICLAVADASILEMGRDRKPDAKPRDLSKDAVLMRGLQALGAVIENPKNLRLRQNFMLPGDALQRQRLGLPPPDPDGFMNQGQVGGRTFYFLWSLERVAVAFDLQTIGNKDWYGWGAEILLNSQMPDGSWVGDHAQSGVDTCFALLFLKRANLAGDLTAELKGKIKDPGERVIRGGGIGGDSLRSAKVGRPQSGIERKKSELVGKGLRDPKLADSDSGRLALELVKATGPRQTAMMEQLRNEKGVKYTEALATAIPRMTDDARRKAREALADRLTRMKAETLATYLQDEDAEIRAASALACAMKESKSLVPKLIPLLSDPESRVVLAAHRALKELTGQDFGPSADASRQDRDQATLKWARWWTKQKQEK
jgi:hypothetical protein